MNRLFLLPLLFFTATVVANNPGYTYPNPPTPAPDFTVTTSDGQVKKLYQDYLNQGKIVVIEAFFTTCPPCATHAPLVQSLYTSMQAAHPGKVEFILLSTLFNDTNVKVAQYKTSKGLTMPAVGKDGGSITALQPYLDGLFGPFQGTPTFIVIAPGTGAVTFDIRGNTPGQTITMVQDKIEEFFPKDCSLTNPFGAPLEAVQIKLHAANFDSSFVAGGSYNLSAAPTLKNASYEIRPYKTGSPVGLTTYDLVLISKHILAIEPFKCPWQILAADVNCTGSVTTFDIVTARKVILGILDSFPCGSWRFMPDSAIVSNGQCQAFVGVALGDVNAGPCTDSLQENADSRTVQRDLLFEDRGFQTGETAEISLFLGENTTLEGLQFVLDFAPELLKINAVKQTSLNAFDLESYRLTEHNLVVSWIQPWGQPISSESPVLTLEVTALAGGKLSDLLRLSNLGIQPELYGIDNQIYTLNYTPIPSISTYLISPNPTNGNFTLQTQASQSGNYLMQMMDIQGRSVLEKSLPANSGFNRWDINTEGQTPGLYFLKVNGKAAGKVILN